MAVLWFGPGEDIEFQNIISGSVMSGGFANVIWRSAYVRGYQKPVDPAATSLSRIYDTIPLASPVTTVWLSCRFYMQNGASNHSIFGMADSTQTFGGIYIGKGSATEKMGLFTVTTGGVETKLTEEAGATFLNNVLHRVDAQITTFNDAATNVKVYLNGNITPTIDWTGDTTGLGITTLDCMRVVAHPNDSPGREGNTEIILADEDTRPFVGVGVLVPNGDG